MVKLVIPLRINTLEECKDGVLGVIDWIDLKSEGEDILWEVGRLEIGKSLGEDCGLSEVLKLIELLHFRHALIGDESDTNHTNAAFVFGIFGEFYFICLY